MLIIDDIKISKAYSTDARFSGFKTTLTLRFAGAPSYSASTIDLPPEVNNALIAKIIEATTAAMTIELREPPVPVAPLIEEAPASPAPAEAIEKDVF